MWKIRWGFYTFVVEIATLHTADHFEHQVKFTEGKEYVFNKDTSRKDQFIYANTYYSTTAQTFNIIKYQFIIHILCDRICRLIINCITEDIFERLNKL